MLKPKLQASLKTAMERFATVDFGLKPFAVLQACQELLAKPEDREAVAAEFLRTEALFELLQPDEELREDRETQKSLAKLYKLVRPAITSDALLWQRLGAKTYALINEHMVSVNIDEETLEALRQSSFGEIETPAADERGETQPEAPTAEEILDSIEKRIASRLAEHDDPRYKSLADRLDRLRQAQLFETADSMDFLKKRLQILHEMIAVSREYQAAEDEGTQLGLLPEERKGAFAQIFHEYKPEGTPEILERMMDETDSVVIGARFTPWQSSRAGTRTVKTEVRRSLTKFGLQATGELFDSAYDSVAENY